VVEVDFVDFITNKNAEVLLASLDSHSIVSKVVSHSTDSV
jgi:hypothetical protein